MEEDNQRQEQGHLGEYGVIISLSHRREREGKGEGREWNQVQQPRGTKTHTEQATKMLERTAQLPGLESSGKGRQEDPTTGKY